MKINLSNWLSIALGALLVLAFSPACAQGGPPSPSSVPTTPVAVPIEVSGVLYGTVINGGASGYGAIWKYVESTGVFSILYSFDGVNAATPYSRLLYASDGYLYGTTRLGGNRGPGSPAPYGYGGVYRIRPDTTGYAFYPFPSIASNITAFGPNPMMGLVEDPVGAVGDQRVFYGTTNVGGATRTTTNPGSGTIYQFTINGSTGTFTKLYDFPAVASDGTNSMGANPMCELVLQTTATTRYLFGTTPTGGLGGGGSMPDPEGTVFSLNWSGSTSLPTPTSATATLINSFQVATGGAPGGSLVLGKPTKGSSLNQMWGTLQANALPYNSGSNGGGVYWLNNGAYSSAVLSSNADEMYTSRTIQGGVLAQVSLQTFGQVCLASDGYLYATSLYGGHLYNVPTPPYNPANKQDGSVYRLLLGDLGGPPNPPDLVWVFRTDADPALSSIPTSGIVEASDGYLYGVTTGSNGSNGGIGNGALYRFPLWTRGQVTLVHQF